ncbi:ATP-binding cassette domain-containing protein [Streptomyces aureocirculatus]|uniref:ATP-binding cassette domain-containing protein n=1 Tax=Streptomyces aureocirculatus TaxID=67275 RepID=UPI000AC573FC
MKPVERRLLRDVPALRRHLARSAALALLGAGLVVAQAALLATLLADGFAGHGVRALPTAALAVVMALRALTTWARGALAQRAAADAKRTLRDRITARLRHTDPLRLAARRHGETATLLTRGLDALDPYVVGYLPTMAATAVVPLTVVAWLLWTDWTSALIVVVTLPLIPVFGALVGLHTAQRTARQWQLLARLGGHFLDVVAGLPTLRAFGRERHQARVVGEMADAHRRATLRTLRVAFLSSFVLETVATLSVALVAVPVGLRLLDGDVSLRTALTVLLLAPEAYLPLRALGAAFHDSAEGVTVAEQVFATLDDDTPARREDRSPVAVRREDRSPVAVRHTGRARVAAQPVDRTGVAAQPVDRTGVAAQPVDRTGVAAQPVDRTGVAVQCTDRTSAPAQRTDRASAPAQRTDRTSAPAQRTDRTSAPAQCTDRTSAPAQRTDRTPAPAQRTDRTPAPAQRTDHYPPVPDVHSAHLCLDAVTVRYPGRAEPALRDVTLALRPGEHVALVGPSGAGKSTLLALLLGFVTPASGRVAVGGTDLADLDPDAWRERLAWVPQRPHLFAASVADNIRLGRPDASDAEVREAARAAAADRFVAELPDAYDTVLGEHGAGLSAGQRQRIALARAFLKDAPVLLLDEPTAHLDPESEAAVTRATVDLMHGRTAVVVAHRTTLLPHAHRVVTVHAGALHHPEPTPAEALATP